MQIDILTIFPSMFDSVFASGILKRASADGKVKIEVHDIRKFARDAHRTVDDAPYGGGAGMVMKPDVLADAVSSVPVAGENRQVVLMSAQGEKLTHSVVAELAKLDQMIVVCGRYEGVDERFIELFVDREISMGDFVTTGGEIPAMAVCDSVVRLIPGVLGNEESLLNESFSKGLLEYPQFTRPVKFREKEVPGVLLSGNHKEIEKWRHEQSMQRTRERRPDLLLKKRNI